MFTFAILLHLIRCVQSRLLFLHYHIYFPFASYFYLVLASSLPLFPSSQRSQGHKSSSLLTDPQFLQELQERKDTIYQITFMLQIHELIYNRVFSSQERTWLSGVDVWKRMHMLVTRA